MSIPPSAGRLSAIELLRLLSMFMVLVLHADYVALDIPDTTLLETSPGAAVGRVVAEQLSIVAVDVFVLISAWFGIRTTLRGVCSLLFQVVFYAVAVLGVYALVRGVEPERCQLAWHSLIPGYDHWFIRDYLGLMILAPVLHAFLENTSRRQHRIICAAYLLFEIVYGWLLGKSCFAAGYSLLSFIGLYLLGSLARREGWQRPGWKFWTGVYLVCALLSAGLALTAIAGGDAPPARLTAYDSPLVILGALSLLLAFAGSRTWRSKAVNTLAASALAVYLLHFNPLLFSDFKHICLRLYNTYSGVAYPAAMAGFLLAVFFASILADRLRLLAWRPLEQLFCRKRELMQKKY